LDRALSGSPYQQAPLALSQQHHQPAHSAVRRHSVHHRQRQVLLALDQRFSSPQQERRVDRLDRVPLEVRARLRSLSVRVSRPLLDKLLPPGRPPLVVAEPSHNLRSHRQHKQQPQRYRDSEEPPSPRRHHRTSSSAGKRSGTTCSQVLQSWMLRPERHMKRSGSSWARFRSCRRLWNVGEKGLHSVVLRSICWRSICLGVHTSWTICPGSRHFPPSYTKWVPYFIHIA
jgi:hypothetical protein